MRCERRAGCRRCGGTMVPEIGYDEDLGDRAVVEVVTECAVCGAAERPAPVDPAEVRTWVRRRLALLRERAA